MDEGCGHWSHQILGGPCRKCGVGHPGQTCEEYETEQNAHIDSIVKAMLATKETKVSIRAKMTLESVIPNTYGGAQAIFRCIYDQKVAEDVSFQKATPSGEARFSIDNPKAMEQLKIGQAYYVDFSEAA